MKALLQRVVSARVLVDEKVVGEIGPGLVVFLGVGKDDGEEDAQRLAGRVAKARIFGDDQGKMNLSALDVEGSLLVVSQFTLYADCQKGHRPSFTCAADPRTADMLYGRFIDFLREKGLKVASGVFRSHMLVEIYNDGPVTILMESRKGPDTTGNGGD